MLPDMTKIALFSEVSIKTVTNVRNIYDAMEKSEIYKGMLGEVNVIRLYLPFPVTSATCLHYTTQHFLFS